MSSLRRGHANLLCIFSKFNKCTDSVKSVHLKVDGLAEDVAAPAADAAEGMETDAPKEEAQEEKKVKKKVKKTDVPVKSFVGGLPADVLERYVNEEYDMALQDTVMEETKERKNAVEACVYSMRSTPSRRRVFHVT